MWYEILPSFGIIVVAMALPHYGMFCIHKLVLGNSYRRSLIDRDLRQQYVRDRLLTDNPYKIQGLEAIPD